MTCVIRLKRKQMLNPRHMTLINQLDKIGLKAVFDGPSAPVNAPTGCFSVFNPKNNRKLTWESTYGRPFKWGFIQHIIVWKPPTEGEEAIQYMETLSVKVAIRELQD